MSCKIKKKNLNQNIYLKVLLGTKKLEMVHILRHKNYVKLFFNWKYS